MPDICMCSGEGCPFARKCYRHTAVGDPYYQSYFVTPPYKEDTGCEYFWDNRERKQVDER